MSWFGQGRKKSPRLNTSGIVSSGSVERPASGSWLEGDGQGLHNPLAWDNMPSALQEKFPHWKESNLTQSQTHKAQAHHSSQVEAEQSYSCYKTTHNIKQQPDYTFPYVVMDHDTLNSIAVKFETTPAELARLNKKPLGPTSTVFTGEVLYVPDQDEMARSAPKSAPPNISVTHFEQFQGSVDSQDTLVSHPPPESSSIPQHQAESKSGAREREEDSHKGQRFLEEVADTHMLLVSRYISDDQGCVHGNVMINHTAFMFTPSSEEPLVKEHGPANFEVMIPLQDIIFAAFTKDVNPPQRKALRAALLAAEEKTADDLSQTSAPTQQTGVREDKTKKTGEQYGMGEGEREGEKEVVEEKEGEREVMEEKEEEREVMGEKEGEGQVEVREVGEELTESYAKSSDGDDSDTGDAGNADNNGEDDKSTQSPARVSASDSHGVTGGVLIHPRHSHPQAQLQESAEELLAIMGAGSPDAEVHANVSKTTSESSVDSFLLSDHPCFLHLRVSHKCSAAHTYIPVNRPVGIDIPHNQFISPNRSLVQQVKTTFCFAVADHRVNDLAYFICKHHPAGVTPHQSYNSLCPSNSSDSYSYEFISCQDSTSFEDLNFTDNHFHIVGAESSESWEVYSLQDVPKFRQKIDKMEVEAGLPLPNLSETSSLMEEPHLRALSNNILSAAVGHDWFLIYSTFTHGISLRTLYRNMIMCELSQPPVILLVRDNQHKLFGAALTAPLKLSEKFYGTGESYLFSFESPTEIKIFPWTGENSYIVKGSSDGICVGCGDGHAGLWLDETLLSGTSEECATFGNTCLSSSPEFTCTGVEAWGFL